MKSKVGKCLMVLCLVIFIVAGCSAKENPTENQEYTSLQELNGKRVGIITGASYEGDVQKELPDAKLLQTINYADAIVAMESDKMDACITEDPISVYQMEEHEGLAKLPGYLTEYDYAFMLSNGNVELLEEVNEAIREMKEDGTIERLKEEWMNPDQEKKMDSTEKNSSSKGVLRVATSADAPPFSYVENNQVVGFDIELMSQIAEKLGYEIEIETMAFSGVVPSIQTGKADIAVGGLSITLDLPELVTFSEPIFHSGTVALVDQGLGIQKTGFWEELKESFVRTFVTEARWKLIGKGLLITLLLSGLSAVLGSLLGFGFSFALCSKNKKLRNGAAGISKILEGIPLVVLLMLLYYVIFKRIDISAVGVGVIGFTIDFANTTAGLLKAGIATVDSGQSEAATAMGYSRWNVFFKIVFPQAVRNVFSQYEDAVVGLIKNTSVIGYIAVEDLTMASDMIRGRTYDAFFPLIATAVLYFLIAHVFVFLLKRVDIRLDPKRRKRAVKGVTIDDPNL